MWQEGCFLFTPLLHPPRSPSTSHTQVWECPNHKQLLKGLGGGGIKRAGALRKGCHQEVTAERTWGRQPETGELALLPGKELDQRFATFLML